MEMKMGKIFTSCLHTRLPVDVILRGFFPKYLRSVGKEGCDICSVPVCTCVYLYLYLIHILTTELGTLEGIYIYILYIY